MNLMQRFQPGFLFDELDRLLDRTSRYSNSAAVREKSYDTPDAWVLRLDLPGFRRDEVSLKVNDRVLELTAESQNERPFVGKIERRWKLGPSVDTAKVSARLENGVFEITLPKKPKSETAPVSVQIQ